MTHDDTNVFTRRTRMSLRAEFKRHELGLSMNQVAERALVSNREAGDFLMCRDGVPAAIARRILKVLGLDPSDLF